MEVLLLLVEQRGRLVTREQIAARLWTEPQSVDVVQGINTAVNRLRAILNDNPSNPRFIETVIGKGYRFIADVEEVEAPVSDASSLQIPLAPNPLQPPPVVPLATVAFESPPLSPPRSFNWLFAGIAAAILLAAGVGLYIYAANRTKVATAEPKLVFQQLTLNDTEDRVTAGAISPDGKLLAYASANGISLRVIQNGTEQTLASPPAFLVDRISWFADDLRLAVSGFATSSLRPQIWMVYVTGKPTLLLRDLARNGAPSPDGNAFAFTSNQDDAVWVGDANGADAHAVVPALARNSFPFVLWSTDSKRVVYQRQRYVPSQSPVSSPKEDLYSNFRWEYESADAKSGRILVNVPNVRFHSACLLPEGRLLYLHWDHVGRRQLYKLSEIQTNTVDGTFRSPPREVKDFDISKVASISASSNGSQIAAILEKAHANVYVAKLQFPGPSLADARRLTRNLHTDFPHAWTADSDAVVFESNRDGKFAVYRQRLDGAKAEIVASMPCNAVLPQVAPGGLWILFACEKSPANRSYSQRKLALYRVPVNGGNVEEVPIAGPLDDFRCPVVRTGGCVLRETVGHQELVYYDLDPVKGKGLELGRTSWSPTVLQDWDVAPDGSAVAFPIHDVNSRTIRIVPLGKSRGARKPEEIVAGTFAGIAGLTWAVDGKGFYAQASTDAGALLLYVDLHGRAVVLKESVSGTWGVPSPDGKKLAFVDYLVDSNVWMSTLPNSRAN